jgi:uncharacterized protein (TIGR02246 family)
MIMSLTNADLVRGCYAAYTTGDRSAMEVLLAEDFTFSSPMDDHINRVAFFERCWPNHEGHSGFEIETLMAEGDEVLVTYSGRRNNGVLFRNTEKFTCRDGKVKSVEVFFGREEGTADDETQIRVLIDATVRACRAKDAEALVADYSDDVVAYDLIDPLRYSSRKEVAARARQWLESFQGPVVYELHDVEVVAGQDVAFCHGLNHVVGTQGEGQKIDMWWRQTLCLQKVAGKWQVTHAHSSVPFDMETGKASLEIRP